MRELAELPEDGVYRESIVSKGTVNKRLEAAKIVEVSRDTRTGVIGAGISEGEVRNGVRVRKGKRILDFVEKVFNRHFYLDKYDPEITLERIISNHAKLKKLGFPVINTMRIVDTPVGFYERIIMTDLTEGGKNIILTSSTHHDGDQSDLSNSKDIKKQLIDVYTKLNSCGVMVCHRDVFFLVIDKETKEGKIVLGDISRVKFADEEIDEPNPLTIETKNYEKIKSFVSGVNMCIVGEQIDF